MRTLKKMTGSAFGKRLLMVCGLVLSGAMAQAGTTYYVATNGSDGASGSSLEPFATIGHALGKAVDGDEIVVLSGTYKLGGTALAKNGTIVLRGETGIPDDVVIDAENKSECLRIAGSMQVSALTFRNGLSSSAANAVALNSADRAQSCYLRNCVISGIIADNSKSIVNVLNNAALIDCRIENCSTKSSIIYADGGILSGVTVGGCVSGTGLTDTPLVYVKNAVLQGCRLTNNSNWSGGFVGTFTEAVGCAVQSNYWNSSDSTARCAGGIVYRLSSYDATARCVIRGCSVVSNVCNSSFLGGGIAVYNAGSALVEGSTSSWNSSSYAAGFYLPNGRDPSLFCVSNCSFVGNVAVGGKGGAIRATGFSLIDSDVTDNSALVSDSDGGGVYVEIGASSDIVISGCRICRNSAAYSGGGVFVAAGVNLSMVGCDVSENETRSLTWTGGGAGVAFKWESSAHGIVDRCKFGKNACASMGGGVLIRHASAGDPTVTVRNSLFVQNESDQSGGGVYFATQAADEIVNCTFSSNTDKSGGGANALHMPNATWAGGTVKNTILYGNSFTVGNKNKFVKCCVAPWVTALNGNATGTFNDDPGFTKASGGDYTLKLGSSPCVDVGVSEPWMVGRRVRDLAGNRRVQGSAIDLGAYECIQPSGMVLFVR